MLQFNLLLYMYPYVEIATLAIASTSGPIDPWPGADMPTWLALQLVTTHHYYIVTKYIIHVCMYVSVHVYMHIYIHTYALYHLQSMAGFSP